MWLIAFFFFLFHAWSGAVWGEEGTKKKKKKKRRGEERKIPSDRECVRARERDETPAAPQSGLHLSTGPQWIQPTDWRTVPGLHPLTTQDVKEVCVFIHQVLLFVWNGGKLSTTREITAWLFLPLLFFFLRSCLTRKWDSGYAASPVE